MKSQDLRILFVLMMASVSLVGWGCASNRVNLLKNETRILQYMPSHGYTVSNVPVDQTGDELVISGRVKRASLSASGTGHVDIAIVSPDGEILEQVSTLCTPRIIPQKRMHNRRSSFEVRLSMIPPKGSTVRTAYHSDSKSLGVRF